MFMSICYVRDGYSSSPVCLSVCLSRSDFGDYWKLTADLELTQILRHFIVLNFGLIFGKKIQAHVGNAPYRHVAITWSINLFPRSNFCLKMCFTNGSEPNDYTIFRGVGTGGGGGGMGGPSPHQYF